MDAQGRSPESTKLYTFDLTSTLLNFNTAMYPTQTHIHIQYAVDKWEEPLDIPDGPAYCGGSGRAVFHNEHTQIAVIGGRSPSSGSLTTVSVWYFGTRRSLSV